MKKFRNVPASKISSYETVLHM